MWESFSRVFEYFMIAAVLVGLWAWQRRASRRRASGGNAPAAVQTGEIDQSHAVIVTSGPIRTSLKPVLALEARLEAAVAGTGLGIVDGHEMAVDGSEASFYLYGPDANALFAAVAPILRADPITAAGSATLRFGDVGDPAAREERMSLAAS